MSSLDGVGGEGLLVGSPDERLDGHLIVARVVVASQAVLVLRRREAQPEPVDDVDRDVLARVERPRVDRFDHGPLDAAGCPAQRHDVDLSSTDPAPDRVERDWPATPRSPPRPAHTSPTAGAACRSWHPLRSFVPLAGVYKSAGGVQDRKGEHVLVAGRVRAGDASRLDRCVFAVARPSASHALGDQRSPHRPYRQQARHRVAAPVLARRLVDRRGRRRPNAPTRSGGRWICCASGSPR